jgi:hypothetical protein
MCGLADFAPQGGDYYLERDIDVPESLLRKVMPDIERWYVGAYLAHLSIADRHREVELKHRSSKREQDKAGLCLPSTDRTSTHDFHPGHTWHRQRRPNHLLFTHALFADPEYITFERKALLVQPRTAQDFDDRLRAHAPHITTVMQSNFAVIMTEVTSSG